MTGRGDSRGAAPYLYALAVAVVAVEAALGWWWARRRFLRYEIAGGSMAPALDPGDFVIVDRGAFASRVPRRGDIVVVADPREPGRTLVKRVANVDLHGALWLLGDNPEASTDSRTFGPVRQSEVVGRVRWRYWPPGNPFGVR